MILLTAIKRAIALPLTSGLAYMSAYNPPMIAVGADAKMPVRRRNMTRDVNVGATAQVNVKIVKGKNVHIKTGRLPRASLRLNNL